MEHFNPLKCSILTGVEHFTGLVSCDGFSEPLGNQRLTPNRSYVWFSGQNRLRAA